MVFRAKYLVKKPKVLFHRKHAHFFHFFGKVFHCADQDWWYSLGISDKKLKTPLWYTAKLWDYGRIPPKPPVSMKQPPFQVFIKKTREAPNFSQPSFSKSVRKRAVSLFTPS